MYGIIYRILNRVNKKIYIGQTVNDFKRRYDCGGIGVERVYNIYKNNIINKKSYNIHLFKSIEKYGFNNFEINEAFDIAFTPEELDKKEIYWIKYYNSNNPQYGYNCEGGGNLNKKISEETRRKLSESQQRRFRKSENKDYMYKRRHSEETRRKISANKTGCKGFPMTNEMKQKLKEAKKKSVICITTMEVFEYMKDACEKYSIKNQGNLSQVCNKKRKHCGQLDDGSRLEWMYYREYIEKYQ